MYLKTMIVSLVSASASASIALAQPAKKVAPAKEINEDAAKEIALKAQSGKVVEIEKEKHKGEEAYSIEIKNDKGLFEVVVRIADGSILENKLEEDDTDEGE